MMCPGVLWSEGAPLNGPAMPERARGRFNAFAQVPPNEDGQCCFDRTWEHLDEG
jgi:hypothetical protein